MKRHRRLVVTRTSAICLSLALAFGCAEVAQLSAESESPGMALDAPGESVEPAAEPRGENRPVLSPSLPVGNQATYATNAREADDDANAIVIGLEAQAAKGPENWTGPADCSAVARLVRGEDGFDVRVDVTDDSLHPDTHRQWEGDSVEIYFDLRPEDARGGGRYERGVFQMIVVPSAVEGGEPHVTFWPNGNHSVPGAKVATRVIEPTAGDDRRGYNVEIFLPFEGLRKNHYMPGDEFNFDLSVNDSDADAGRETQLIWSGKGEPHHDASVFVRMRPAGGAE